ncbi:MAG TPA: hypothetical protein VL307_04150 [Chitinophagaceae bacterium]|nr:hypothetical protein [Chitinophagaceae bacterium]
MLELPFYIYLLFAASVITAAIIVLYAIKFEKRFTIVMLGWLLLQTLLSLSGFYTAVQTGLPRLPLLIAPVLASILSIFFIGGRRFLDSLNIKTLTLVHIVRIPVEIVLYGLFVHKAIPGLMTFEGRNFDIVSGLTAPFIYYFGCIKKKVGKQGLLLWNILCLLLLFNIIVNSLLSAPSPLQRFAFNQPNIAFQFFPFALLPSFIVPLVLLAHMAAIRQLSLKIKKNQ